MKDFTAFKKQVVAALIEKDLKKNGKMDQKLISKEPWELSYVTRRYGVEKEDLIVWIDENNNSRTGVYDSMVDYFLRNQTNANNESNN